MTAQTTTLPEPQPIAWPPPADAETLRRERAELDDARRALAKQAEDVAAELHETRQRARSEADKIVTDARTRAAAELQRARDAAAGIREAAAVETERAERRAADLDTWSVRGIIAGAVGLTASGEYSLARLVGFDGSVAWLLPLVIDIYVVQAFRRHRDVLPAIGLTVAVNVVYHLADAGLVGVTASGKPAWWMIAVVASIASFILWRSHAMTAAPRERRPRRRERRRESETEYEIVREREPDMSHETAAELSPDGEALSLPAAREHHETGPEPTRESARETASTSNDTRESESESAPTESAPKPRTTRPRRESRKSQTGSQPRADESVEALLALMRKRASADAVTIHDAERIVGKSYATNARKLAAARDLYNAETADRTKDET